MKTKYFTTTTLLICCAMVAFAFFADLTGKWVGTVNAGGNPITLTYVFKVDGNNLTGSIQSPQGEIPISEGKVNGNDFSFKIDFNGTTISNVGKYYTDSIGVDAIINDNKFHTTLKRVVN